MEKYINTMQNDEIIFKNLLDNSGFKIKHYDDDNTFDTISINEKYDLDFIDYVIKRLKASNDILILFAEYDSPVLEKMLYKNGFRVFNYQYTIKKSKNFKLGDYEISNILDEEGKNFYLEIINKLTRENHQYLNPGQQYQEFGDYWFKNDELNYRVYRQNGKIVGVVDYWNCDYDSNDDKTSNNEYDNKLGIRCLLSEEEQVLEDILKDLLNVYKKDIVIHITYNENNLKNVVNKMNGKFDFCEYILAEKK